VRYMLLMNYAAPSHTPDCKPMTEWSPEAVEGLIGFMHDFNAKLQANGELVGAEGLAGPEAAKIVWSTGDGAPVVTDGPFAESKELLAGYWIVDVETPERAIEIAAAASEQPGHDGRPLGVEIEVREIMGAPSPEV